MILGSLKLSKEQRHQAIRIMMSIGWLIVDTDFKAPSRIAETDHLSGLFARLVGRVLSWPCLICGEVGLCSCDPNDSDQYLDPEMGGMPAQNTNENPSTRVAADQVREGANGKFNQSIDRPHAS
jgi:hypothetical protein